MLMTTGPRKSLLLPYQEENWSDEAWIIAKNAWQVLLLRLQHSHIIGVDSDTSEIDR